MRSQSIRCSAQSTSSRSPGTWACTRWGGRGGGGRTQRWGPPPSHPPGVRGLAGATWLQGRRRGARPHAASRLAACDRGHVRHAARQPPCPGRLRGARAAPALAAGRLGRSPTGTCGRSGTASIGTTCAASSRATQVAAARCDDARQQLICYVCVGGGQPWGGRSLLRLNVPGRRACACTCPSISRQPQACARLHCNA